MSRGYSGSALAVLASLDEIGGKAQVARGDGMVALDLGGMALKQRADVGLNHPDYDSNTIIVLCPAEQRALLVTTATSAKHLLLTLCRRNISSTSERSFLRMAAFFFSSASICSRARSIKS
jgi:hypothetical protein